MRAAFLVLLLWAVAYAHPVPGHEPTHPSALQEDATNEDYIGSLGNHLDGGDTRHPPGGPETGANALAGDLTGGNAVDEGLGELSGQDAGGRAGQAQHVNQVDHEDVGTHSGNDLGFLEADARDAEDGDIGERYGAGAHAFPSHGGGFLDEEDDSGDDTFDANGEEERGEGPTYVAGADGAGEGDAGRGDAGAGGRRGDSSSSSSSSESVAADHRRYGNRGFGRAYGHGGASSSSQEEEESYDFQDEAVQGDDPSVFDGPGSSYRMRHAGPRALGNSWESAQGAGSHRWEEGDSRSPEVEDGDSGEDSPSVEENSQSEEPEDSQSEEKSSSHSQEDGDGDGEDSPSREDEDSESREDTDEQSDEEPGETPEVVRTLNEHGNSQTWEGQEDWDSAEDRSVLSTPDSESREEEEAELSKSREDADDQSQSTEDTVEESEEDRNDSAPSTSAESPESPEDDSSPEDNTGEDSRSTESDTSESQEDDDDVESHSQEDATRESSSRGDDSSLQSRGRKRRLGALRHRPAADYDDNDCQDGY